METTFRFEIHTSGNQDVFNVAACSYIGGHQSDIAEVRIDKSDITSFQVTFKGYIDRVCVFFEEHEEMRTMSIKIERDQLGGEYGIRYDEIPNPNDEPTYAGIYTYAHPLFKFSEVEYDSIVLNSQPNIIPMDHSENNN